MLIAKNGNRTPSPTHAPNLLRLRMSTDFWLNCNLFFANATKDFKMDKAEARTRLAMIACDQKSRASRHPKTF